MQIQSTQTTNGAYGCLSAAGKIKGGLRKVISASKVSYMLEQPMYGHLLAGGTLEPLAVIIVSCGQSAGKFIKIMTMEGMVTQAKTGLETAIGILTENMQKLGQQPEVLEWLRTLTSTNAQPGSTQQLKEMETPPYVDAYKKMHAAKEALSGRPRNILNLD